MKRRGLLGAAGAAAAALAGCSEYLDLGEDERNRLHRDDDTPGGTDRAGPTAEPVAGGDVGEWLTYRGMEVAVQSLRLRAAVEVDDGETVRAADDEHLLIVQYAVRRAESDADGLDPGRGWGFFVDGQVYRPSDPVSTRGGPVPVVEIERARELAVGGVGEASEHLLATTVPGSVGRVDVSTVAYDWQSGDAYDLQWRP
jgi:hypothetical protein